jgi:hypothetical protein
MNIFSKNSKDNVEIAKVIKTEKRYSKNTFSKLNLGSNFNTIIIAIE